MTCGMLLALGRGVAGDGRSDHAKEFR